MKMSDIIAGFIGDMLLNGGGVAELSRKDLADRFSCVPSQINYVLETRFSPESGYIVESRRGGGGYIRVMRVINDKQAMILDIAQNLDSNISFNGVISIIRYLISCNALSENQGKVLVGACSDNALSIIEDSYRNRVRSGILKYGLMSLTTD